MGCCGSSSASNVVRPGSDKKAPGAATLPVLHPVNAGPLPHDTERLFRAHVNKQIGSTKTQHEQTIARGIQDDLRALSSPGADNEASRAVTATMLPVASTATKLPVTSSVETPIATPKSYDTLMFQEVVFVDFTEEERNRDRLATWNDERKEFMRWNEEEQIWEEMCTTPTYTPQTVKSAIMNTPRTERQPEANVWVPTWMNDLASRWHGF